MRFQFLLRKYSLEVLTQLFLYSFLSYNCQAVVYGIKKRSISPIAIDCQQLNS